MPVELPKAGQYLPLVRVLRQVRVLARLLVLLLGPLPMLAVLAVRLGPLVVPMPGPLGRRRELAAEVPTVAPEPEVSMPGLMRQLAEVRMRREAEQMQRERRMHREHRKRQRQERAQ